jgi:prephenate dehydrogenase
LNQISIIGLTPASVSLGLSLKKLHIKNTDIIAFSTDTQKSKTVRNMQAFDLITDNTEKAFQNAQLIFIDQPLSDLKESFESIANLTLGDSIVTDFSSSKKLTSKWAKDILPGHISYVPARPLLKKNNPDLQDATIDDFQGIKYCVMESAETSNESLQIMIKLIESLGAIPYFLDLNEHDSYSAAMEYLPPLVATALMNTTSKSDAWKEMNKFNSYNFDTQTALSNNDPLDNEIGCISISEPLIYWIDQMITSLYSIRNNIDSETDNLLEYFIHGWEQRGRLDAGLVNNHPSGPDIPSSAQSIASTFFGDKIAKRMSSEGHIRNRKTWQYPR